MAVAGRSNYDIYFETGDKQAVAGRSNSDIDFETGDKQAVAGRSNSDLDCETGDEQREVCELCNISTIAGYCLECEMHICQSCFDRHRKRKKNKNHVLQDVAEIETGITPICFDICAEHAQQPVKLYCTDHKVPGCAECMLFEHRTCKHEYITVAAKRFKQSGDLARVQEDIELVENTHSECDNAIVSKREATEMMTKSATYDIETFVESIITYANEAKQKLLEEVKVRESENKLEIDKLEEDIQMIGSQLAALSLAFQSEEQIHKRFLLAVETTQKVSSVRIALSAIDYNSVITEYKFLPSKLFNDMVSNSRPVGRYRDSSQNQTDEEDDLECKLKQERKKSHLVQQQLSERENELNKLRSNFGKLEDKQATLMKLYKEMETEIQRLRNEVTLWCGHTSSIENMEKNRTIRCNICNIIFGDQPGGTMQSTLKRSFMNQEYYELRFTFPPGIQMKLNCSPGNVYTGTSKTGYLFNDNKGNAILRMLKLAFDRKLLFTVDCNGSITLGGIELSNGNPYYMGMLGFNFVYPGYIARVKKQLAAVGIRNW